MSTNNIGVSFIRTDGGTQARAGLDEATVIEYTDAMRDGAEFPPVTLFYDGTDYWLGDGFHRVEARRRLKDEGRGGAIAVDLRQGTRRDAVLFAAQANASHGLRRSADDKRRAVMCLLNDGEWGKWSDREIARRCHVSPTLVGKLRGEVVTVHVDSEPVERTYVTRHGTEAVMKTGNIGRASDSERATEANVDAAAYEDIHSLQRFIVVWIGKQWLDDLAKQAEILEFMKADGKHAYWTGLSLDLARAGKVFRKNDLVQALNNALDTLRYVKASREKIAQPALSQPAEPAQEKDLLDKQNTLEARLLDALHLRQESARQWQERRQDGMTDEQIKEVISREWGLGHGSSGPGLVYMNCKGGSDPKFWHNAGVIDKPTLRGAALIAKVREVLQMPYPQPASEPAPAPAPVLNGEQTQPEPAQRPRIPPYVMGYFQAANEAIVRIATAIPKAQAGDFRDMMAIRASLEQMEKRIGSEYDMS